MSKRFYKQAKAGELDGVYSVFLDGRGIKTPGKKPLLIDNLRRAKIAAAEWEAQGEEILPQTMPCTRLLNVACELTPARRPEMIKEFAQYCETDLLCYRSAVPADLADRQNARWQPVLDWAADTHKIALATTTGLAAQPQAESSLKAARGYAALQTDIDLTLLLHFTATLGSAILALAVMEGHISIAQAYGLSRLDEAFQNERWGEDEDAAARSADIANELGALGQLIESSHGK